MKSVSRRCGAALVAAGFAVASLATSPLRAAVPTVNKVVIVIEENHSEQSIIDQNGVAPYINGLAAQGASFSNFFAISHPSQPNYLQLFSGGSQGVYDNL